MFDYAFAPDATQDNVYDEVARPVVSEMLQGTNGTIFAYGQTGTGKTYTMGILDFISSEDAGIIPRALSQIFNHVEDTERMGNDVLVTLSFLQLYRESIQDLLAPGLNYAQSSVDEAIRDLNIREDPRRGFYVEGR